MTVKQTLYRTATVKNHVHTQDGMGDIPAGTIVGVRYVGQARHPWLRTMTNRYAVTYAGVDRGIFWERDLHRFVF